MVGQIVADVLVYPVEKVDFGMDTQCVESIRLANGGDAMNVAIDLSRLGSHVAFCGCMGNDSFGEYLENKLEANDIDISGVIHLTDAAASTCLCLINPAGERCFFYCGGASERMRQEYVTDKMLGDCRAVHVGGTFLLPEMDGEGTARLFERAHGKGIYTSMDVTWDTTGRWNSLIEPCYPHLDLFMPSLNEAKHIARTDDPEAIADFFLERGVGTAVVKLGSRGCFIKNKEYSFYGGIYPVQPVDTTGAGDAFVAGFLHAELAGMNPERCARWGRPPQPAQSDR